MNKIYRPLLYNVGIIILISILAYILLLLIKYDIPPFLIFLPILTISMTGSLAIIVKQYLKKDKVLEVAEILIVRMLFLFPFIVLLIAGVLINKKDIVLFTILFAIYYVVFAVTETRTLIKLTKKEI